jgi:hypothetical protein
VSWPDYFFFALAFTGALAFAAGFFAAAFLATGFALAALGFALFALTAAFTLAGAFTAGAAAFLALLAAIFPFAIGSSQQTISLMAQLQASSTVTMSPHTWQLNKSPFFALAIEFPPQ